MSKTKLTRAAITDAIRRFSPRIPAFDCDAVADHLLDSRSLNRLPIPEAVWLSLVAYVRHVYTDYEELLASDHEVESARFFVVEQINGTLKSWGATRKVEVLLAPSTPRGSKTRDKN